MGNSGSSIGDLFFPDNPNRRRRAEELLNNIQGFKAEFDQLNRQRSEIIDRIRPKLDELLRARGFNSTEELEKKVREVLSSEELKKYDALRSALNITDSVQSIAWDIISLIGLGSGIVIGGAFLLGVVSGAAAIASIAAVGEILLVVGAIVIIFGVIEGAIERSKLQDAINDLWPKRAQMKQYLEQMRAIANWASAIDIWLKNPTTSDPKILDQLLVGTLDRDYKEWTLAKVDSVLFEADKRNGSWTNEDPHRGWQVGTVDSTRAMKGTMYFASYDEVHVLVRELTITPSETSGGGGQDELKPLTATFTYDRLENRQACFARTSTALWEIIAIPLDPKHISLKTVLFDFIELPPASRPAPGLPDSDPVGRQLKRCTVEVRAV